jgi:ribosomal protein S18 acetylase RimI-like enzyme
MNIKYKDTKQIEAKALQALYLSVDWDSGNHPKKLTQAIAGSTSVFTAWDRDRLVGLINVLSDGHMAAYVHYLLVQPEYQGHSIGKTLVEMVGEAYANVLHLVLVAYNDQIEFYERCGFELPKNASPMFMTQLRI